MASNSNNKPLSWAERLRYGLEAAAFFFFMGFFRLLGLDAASAVGGFIGRNIFYRTGISNRARENLTHAFPEKSRGEIEAIIVEMWDNLGRTVAEYPHLDKISMVGKMPRVDVPHAAVSDEVVARGKGVMFISGHFANWETMPVAAAQRGYEGGIVYRPVNNPYVDRWISKQRAKSGPKEQATKGAQGTRKIFSILRRGQSVFLLVDQKTNEGLPVPFFGRDAMTTPAPASLALKLGAELLPVSNERLKGAHFRMHVHQPISYEPTGDEAKDTFELTKLINQRIEEMVRARPSQWLWIHRRWPTAKDVAVGKRGTGAEV